MRQWSGNGRRLMIGAGVGSIIAAAVDDQSAAREKSDADARARSASERNGVAFHIERPVVQAAQAGSDRERKLRAGAKTGMGGNDLRNVHGMSVVERQHAFAWS